MSNRNVNWEPDVRKTMEMHKETGGKFQQQVDELAKSIREDAVSPLDAVAEGLGFINSVSNGRR